MWRAGCGQLDVPACTDGERYQAGPKFLKAKFLKAAEGPTGHPWQGFAPCTLVTAFVTRSTPVLQGGDADAALAALRSVLLELSPHELAQGPLMKDSHTAFTVLVQQLPEGIRRLFEVRWASKVGWATMKSRRQRRDGDRGCRHGVIRDK